MSADNVYFYANLVLVGALLLGAIATGAVIASGNIRDTALRGDIANANARAAEAELELAKFRTPRANLLTPEVKASIVEKLKPFAGTKFDVGHDARDREVWDFLWNFEPLLTQAGWVQLDWLGGSTFRKDGWPGDHWYGVANVNNVSIEIRPAARPALMPAADALSMSLKAIGIEAHSDNNNSSENGDALHLLVGPKR